VAEVGESGALRFSEDVGEWRIREARCEGSSANLVEDGADGRQKRLQGGERLAAGVSDVVETSCETHQRTGLEVAKAKRWVIETMASFWISH
jgi:hypothetical protein